MNEEEKKKWRSRNAIKLLIAYCLLIALICTLDYFGIPEDKSITTGQETCGVIGGMTERARKFYFL
jgi:hypothetical protein